METGFAESVSHGSVVALSVAYAFFDDNGRCCPVSWLKNLLGWNEEKGICCSWNGALGLCEKTPCWDERDQT